MALNLIIFVNFNLICLKDVVLVMPCASSKVFCLIIYSKLNLMYV